MALFTYCNLNLQIAGLFLKNVNKETTWFSKNKLFLSFCSSFLSNDP